MDLRDIDGRTDRCFHRSGELLHVREEGKIMRKGMTIRGEIDLYNS